MTASSTGGLITDLRPSRRLHSLNVARKAAAAAAGLLDPTHLADLVTAAQLHDVGYRLDLATTGFHPLDGAAAARDAGYPDLVCHLIATHTGAPVEAAARGIPANAFDPYDYPDEDAAPLRAVLAWADLTTGPTGATITVDERLEDILDRYPPADVVHRNTTANRAWLLAAGQHPLGALDHQV